ncbi:gap junction beta-6 protein-like isoform X3 [Melanotaenia boesemani]|uniref:gap junction beta-6 protein-like isoform X3 n=1 Tax=Melanotaenia boesemani TaxID=1250792 RepID=UPI001C03ECCC|nr:gap junction beta-6 protein-like isoform X3 [Melanotaenia boesemani]
MSWPALYAQLVGANRHSTSLGKIWLSVLFIFRVMVLVVAAESVWGDEQSDFVCNTLQSSSRAGLLGNKSQEEDLEALKKRRHPITGALWWMYLCSLVVRLLFEAGFMYALYVVYDGFQMPRLVQCDQWPCPNLVDCFISRPTEKTIFTIFMATASSICMVLNMAELAYLIAKAITRSFCRQKERKSTSREKMWIKTNQKPLVSS